MVGKLKWLKNKTSLDISYATHQIGIFSVEPHLFNDEVVSHLAEYIQDTKIIGLVMKLDKSKCFKVYNDANLSHNWNWFND